MLRTTGQTIVLLTAGNGLIRPASRELYELTHRRFLHAGPSSFHAFNMICVRQAPVHAVPWVQWPGGPSPADGGGGGASPQAPLPAQPPWVNLFFFPEAVFCQCPPAADQTVRSSLLCLEALAQRQAPLFVPDWGAAGAAVGPPEGEPARATPAMPQRPAAPSAPADAGLWAELREPRLNTYFAPVETEQYPDYPNNYAISPARPRGAHLFGAQGSEAVQEIQGESACTSSVPGGPSPASTAGEAGHASQSAASAPMAGNPLQFDWADPMGPAYAAMFYLLLAITGTSERPLDPDARGLQWSFLVPWYACVAGDWLQGPYVYALYDAYGFDRRAISQLFVAGFASSMSCQAYCILCATSCATKHFASYWVLMAGRVTGGVATSLLFSCFESWLVSEARERRGLSDRHVLEHIFALMWFGNSLVAILAGVLGDVAVGAGGLRSVAGGPLHLGGYCSAFDLAILLLLVGLGLVSCLWEENYGSGAEVAHCDLVAQVRAGAQSILRSKQLMVIMVMVACFEGSMYTFVFHWTPALSNAYSTPAFGMVFASFMMAYMCGSSTFDLLSSRGVAVMRLIQGAFSLGALGFLISGVGLAQRLGFARLVQVYLGFLIFEFCCGLYFPSSSTIKGELVPEGVRSTVYNLYRVPMNAIVLVTLLSDIPMTAVFSVCFLLLAAAGASTASLRAPTSQSLKGAADQEYGAVDEGRVKREA
ncbi:unnamed protein product [Prorocentrum cordatum]|uniref:Molybdate-anion transporter n=1 Tax=Prorocentrum cordatum TaxID=2364126 RepID=A0ABN9QSL6_9DINO|nr:unnamed protein product [Polarella glacialis]